MSEYEFQSRIPVDHAMHLVAIVRSGQLMSRKGEALVEIGAVSGELGTFIKQYENPAPFAMQVPTTIEAVMAELDKIEEEDKATLAGASPEQLAGNAYWVALIIQLVKLLLNELT